MFNFPLPNVPFTFNFKCEVSLIYFGLFPLTQLKITLCSYIKCTRTLENDNKDIPISVSTEPKHSGLEIGCQSFHAFSHFGHKHIFARKNYNYAIYTRMTQKNFVLY
jgi:hypothetical protein